MPRKPRAEERPLVIAHISLGTSDHDHDATVEFLGRHYRLLRLGVDGDLRTAETLARRWAQLADVVAVGGASEAKAAGLLHDDPARAARRLAAAAAGGTVTDGHHLHDVLQEWAVRRVHAEMPGYFTNARTVVLGDGHNRSVGVLREYTGNLHFEDPSMRLDLQRRLRSNPVLGLAGQLTSWPLHQVPACYATRSARLPRRSAGPCCARSPTRATWSWASTTHWSASASRTCTARP